MMVSSSLRASLVALVASMVTVSAAPAITIDIDLTVTLSPLGLGGDGSENVKVITTVANTGGKTVKLLKDPRGILHSIPEDSFTVTDAAGSHPPFIGAMVNYSPTYAASLGDSSAYIILPPGTSTNVIHDLAAAYDFTKSGAGEYSVEPSNLFTIVDDDGTLQDIHATVGNTAKVKLSRDLPASRVHDKRASFKYCTADQQSQIIPAISSAKSLARNASSYMFSISGATPRYTTWFGAYERDLPTQVNTHFGQIASENFSKFTYACHCVDPYTFAWAQSLPRGAPGVIYLCDPFWKAPITGTNSKAGALIHAAAQFARTAGAKEYALGQIACKELANDTPGIATKNADSHKYFAENDPPLA